MDADCPTIKTTGGLVKGKLSKAVHPSAKIVYNYLSIPYGKAPIGKRRFLAPEKVDPWNDTLQAVYTLKNCPQDVSVADFYDKVLPFKNDLKHNTRQFDEDCLKLSVFTPECNNKANMPVMVWLTGGHYQRSYAGRSNGTPLAGLNDVVVVVPNFRVNAFGFLSLGRNSRCPGNNALLDVILALEWVRDNIAAFGGDPSNVTIFGESSGSGMTQSLMMSPLARGLYHRAILQSGSILSAFLFSEDLSLARDDFLTNLGLDAKTMEDEEILEKLQALPAEKIMEAQKGFNNHLIFMPTLDGHVINDVPSNLLKGGHVHRVPLLIGCTDSEGGGMLSMRSMPEIVTGITEDVARKFFVESFNAVYKTSEGDAIFEMIKNLYLKEEDADNPLRFSKLHGDIFSDSVFVVPSIVSASAHVAMGLPTYYYQMTQRPEFNHSEKNGPEVVKRPAFVGCDHADDLHFVWGVPFQEGRLSGGAHFTEGEAELSLQVMKYFTNFAKTGNPNKPETVEVEWPAYSVGENRQHMVLQMPLKTGCNLALDKVAFFQQLTK